MSKRAQAGHSPLVEGSSRLAKKAKKNKKAEKDNAPEEEDAEELEEWRARVRCLAFAACSSPAFLDFVPQPTTTHQVAGCRSPETLKRLRLNEVEALLKVLAACKARLPQKGYTHKPKHATYTQARTRAHTHRYTQQHTHTRAHTTHTHTHTHPPTQ